MLKPIFFERSKRFEKVSFKIRMCAKNISLCKEKKKKKIFTT